MCSFDYPILEHGQVEVGGVHLSLQRLGPAGLQQLPRGQGGQPRQPGALEQPLQRSLTQERRRLHAEGANRMSKLDLIGPQPLTAVMCSLGESLIGIAEIKINNSNMQVHYRIYRNACCKRK